MSSTTIDIEQRQLYTDRRAARIARGHERRAARERKRSALVLPGLGGLLEAWQPLNAAESASDSPPANQDAGRRAAPPAIPPTVRPQATANPQPTALPTAAAPVTTTPAKATIEPETIRPAAIGNASREQRIAAFRARRAEVLRQVRREAKLRLTREGAERAVADAFSAVAHPQAHPWQHEREHLDQALADGEVRQVRHRALDGARRAAHDSARTSKHAPDDELACAVSVAFMVIASAPRVAAHGRGAQRSHPEPDPRRQRPFWR